MEDNEDLFNFETETETEAPESTNQEASQEDFDYEQEDYENVEDSQDSESKNYIDLLLEAKGVKGHKIQIQDETGEMTETNFDDLSDQEKFDFLNQSYSDTNYLNDDEIQALNYLRSNKMSLKDFADWQKNVGVQEYLSRQQPKTDIDTYTDDEIIAYDFIRRFGDEMTDEEIDTEIERLKEDEDAYNKRVNLLRTSYKNEEMAQAKLYEDEQAKQSEENQQRFIQAYNNAFQNLDSIQGIELDNNDKNELYQFILAKDPNNRTEFSKLLDDPEQVIKMAWFAKHGEQAMNDVIDYFKKEITKRDKGGTRVINKQASKSSSKDAFRF